MGRALSARWGARAAGSSPAPVWNHPRPSCPSPRRQGRGARPLTPHMLTAPRGAALMLFYLRSREKGRPWPSGAGRGGAGGEGSASHRNAEGGGGSSSSLPAPPQSAKRPTLSDQAPSWQETSRTRKRHRVWNTAQRTSPTASRQPCGVLGGDGTGGGSLRKLRKCLSTVLCAWHRCEIIANIASHGKTNTSKKYIKHQNTLKSMSDCLPS